jgi:hypothetical protein
MTLGNLLSWLAEWTFGSLLIAGLYILGRWIYAWVWSVIRYGRLKRELTPLDRISLEAIATMPRRTR